MILSQVECRRHFPGLSQCFVEKIGIGKDPVVSFGASGHADPHTSPVEPPCSTSDHLRARVPIAAEWCENNSGRQRAQGSNGI
jgi:hypothetical protein